MNSSAEKGIRIAVGENKRKWIRPRFAACGNLNGRVLHRAFHNDLTNCVTRMRVNDAKSDLCLCSNAQRVGIGMPKELAAKGGHVVLSRTHIIRNPQIWEFILLAHLYWSASVLLHSGAHSPLVGF
jgi:hypothetical protein